MFLAKLYAGIVDIKKPNPNHIQSRIFVKQNIQIYPSKIYILSIQMLFICWLLYLFFDWLCCAVVVKIFFLCVRGEIKFLPRCSTNMKSTSKVKLSRRLVIWEANEITKIIAIVYKPFPLTIKEHVTFALNNSVRGAAMLRYPFLNSVALGPLLNKKITFY